MPKKGDTKRCPGSIVYVGKHPTMGGGFIEDFTTPNC